jgi:hypothetical protein
LAWLHAGGVSVCSHPIVIASGVAPKSPGGGMACSWPVAGRWEACRAGSENDLHAAGNGEISPDAKIGF